MANLRIAAACALAAALAGGATGSPVASAAVSVPTGTALILGGATLRAWAPALITRIDPWTAKYLPDIDAGYYTCPAVCATSVVDYPRTAGALFGPNALDVDGTITVGSGLLLQRLKTAAEPTVVAALSLGSVTADASQSALESDPDRPATDGLTFIVAGDPSRVTPLSTAVGAFLPVGFHVPIVGWTVTRASSESIYDTIVVVGEYDLIADFPDRPWNVVTDINAVFGFFYGHAEASLASPGDLPARNVVVTTNSQGASTTTYLVPSSELPMLKPLNGIVPPKVMAAVNKILKPIVDKGYSRNDSATGAHQPYLQPTDGWPTLVKPNAVPVQAVPVQAAPLTAAATTPISRSGGARDTAPTSARSLPHRRSGK